ncbi:MAG: hypothetical protein RLZZ143_3747 [Cyanobacteriota bacterium]
MSNETVTYSLDVVLKEIKDSIKEVSQKFDKIDERLTKVEIGIADLKGDIKVLDGKIEGIDNRLISVEGTQKNQVWTLIILLGSAIITIISELSNLNKTTVNPTQKDKTLFLVDQIFSLLIYQCKNG